MAKKTLSNYHHKIAETLEIALPIVTSVLPEGKEDDARYFYNKIVKIEQDEGIHPLAGAGGGGELGLLLLPFTIAASIYDGIFNSHAKQLKPVRKEFLEYADLVLKHEPTTKYDLPDNAL